MMQFSSDPCLQKHSLLNMMNRFLAATNNMDETIMVPSLLRDVPLVEQDEDVRGTVHHDNDTLVSPNKQRDMYEHYLLLKSIKSEMEWGLLKRDMGGSTSFLEMAVKQEEKASKVAADDGLDLEGQFHFHLLGLFGVLSKLTDQADHLTNRYKMEIGCASLIR